MKQILKCIFFVYLLAACNSLDAQQIPFSSFSSLNNVFYNPAIGGKENQNILGAGFRTQWAGIPDAPVTSVILGNKFLNKDHVGIGGIVTYDKTGPTSRTGVTAAYSYHVHLGDSSVFSMGISGTLTQYTFDKARLLSDLGANDPVIQGDNNKTLGDAGFGLAYATRNLLITASVANLVQSRIVDENASVTGDGSRNFRHYYLHSSYLLQAGMETELIPYVQLMSVSGAPTEWQGGLNVRHHDLFWYGIGRKGSEAWAFSVGLRAGSKLNVSYGFDLFSKPLSGNGGTAGHEFLLLYQFKK